MKRAEDLAEIVSISHSDVYIINSIYEIFFKLNNLLYTTIEILVVF